MTQLNRAEDWHLVRPMMPIYRTRTRRKVREGLGLELGLRLGLGLELGLSVKSLITIVKYPLHVQRVPHIQKRNN